MLRGALWTTWEQEKLPAEIAAEKAQLLSEGFGSWTQEDFSRFMYANHRYGRNDIEQIAKEVKKPIDDVFAYAKVSFSPQRAWQWLGRGLARDPALFKLQNTAHASCVPLKLRRCLSRSLPCPCPSFPRGVTGVLDQGAERHRHVVEAGEHHRARRAQAEGEPGS